MTTRGTLDPFAIAIFRGLVDPLYSERDLALGIEFSKITTMTVKAGQFGGSAGAGLAIRAAKAELRERGGIAKQVLLNVADSAGVPLDDTFSAAMGEIMDAELEQQAADLKARTLSHSLCKGNSAASNGIGEIDGEVVRLGKLYRAEFDHMVLRQKNHPVQHNSNPVLNIAGNVGVIQTGANSSVTGDQQFGQGEIASLAAALQVLLAEVRNLPDTALTIPKGDVIDALQATIQEAEKPKPNRLTLKSMWGGLREGLSTVSQLRGVVETVDAATQFIHNL